MMNGIEGIVWPCGCSLRVLFGPCGCSLRVLFGIVAVR